MTREPIHVYLLESREGEYYVSTSYADGRPASARVSLNGSFAATTNRYGVARISVPPESGELVVTAVDDQGAQGRTRQRVYRGREPLAIQADRTLYRSGEPIRLEVRARNSIPGATLHVLRNGKPLHAQQLGLSAGRYSAVIPWRAEFVHRITLIVVDWGHEHPAVHSVIYPADRDLKVRVQPGQTAYRPGDEAKVVLETRLRDGSAAEAALGVVVVDAAVGERARTDAESVAEGRFHWRWEATGRDQLNGISLNDLYRLDTSAPIPDDLQLLAEVILAESFYRPNLSRSADYEGELQWKYSRMISGHFGPAAAALEARYKQDYHYPRSAGTLRDHLRTAGIDLDSLRDPWGTPYAVRFGMEGAQEGFSFASAGPDRTFDTPDYFRAKSIRWSWFQEERDRIDRILQVLPEFPETEQEARGALWAHGVELEEMRDPWGNVHQVHFRISKNLAELGFRSAGADGTFGTDDDVSAGTVRGDYFKDRHMRLSDMLIAAKPFPQNLNEWNRLLRVTGLEPVTDPWGRRAYLSFGQVSKYVDIHRSSQVSRSGGQAGTGAQVVPATQTSAMIRIRSAGPDGVEGSRDDIDLAVFSQPVKTETTPKRRPPAIRGFSPRSGDLGAIAGLVSDPMGGVIPGAHIRIVTAGGPEREYELRTDSKGMFLLDGLTPGSHDLRAGLPGFQMAIFTRIAVSRGKTASVNVVLQLTGLSETVTVTADAPQLYTSTAAVALSAGVSDSGAPRFTPRLREHFPETLLWQVLVETGAEVDRRSLDDAVQTAGWDLNHYDILPDRVVAYLWP